MKSLLSCSLCLALAASIAVMGVNAQQTPGAKQEEQKVTIGTSEVMVDVVVRDKKGRTVNGLTKSDFQITEDEVPQDIQSFREVRRQPPASAAELAKLPVATGPNGKPDPFSGISVVALVFDKLTPSPRELARNAAQSYVSSALKPDDLTGVFAVGAGLAAVQTYTSDPKLLKAAVDKATGESASTFTSNAETIRNMIQQKETLEDSTASATSGAQPNPTGVGASAAELALMQSALRTEQEFDDFENTQQGRATDYALLAVIDSLSQIPGRKAIMFFSEGVAIPASVEDTFKRVISAANRANVTMYTIDAAGLRAKSTLEDTSSNLGAMASERARQVQSGKDNVGGALTKTLERNENQLRADPHSGLGMLADQTGGFMISDTNSLTNGLRRIDEDLRTHYELTYISKNQNYDGKFRTIAVKLDRSGLDVMSRKGYFAVNSTLASAAPGARAAGGTAVDTSYQLPAIAALNKSVTSDFQVYARSMSFPQQSREGLVAIVASAPASSFTFKIDPATQKFSTDFSFVSVVKDQSGKTVQQVGNHYTLAGTAEQAASFKGQEILFVKQIQLSPGKYTVQTVAYDALSGKAGVQSSPLEIPASGDDSLRLSSLMVVRRAEKLAPADANMVNPFRYQDMLLYPDLGAPLKKDADAKLGFFFNVYPAQTAAAPPKTATLEILVGGESLKSLPLDLPAPDPKAGCIQYTGGFPLNVFPPGSYDLRVTVSDGKDNVSRTVGFTVE